MGSCRRWKRWSPGPLWLAELQKASCDERWGWPGGEGLDIWLEEGEVWRGLSLVSPHFNFSQLCVCVHLSVSNFSCYFWELCFSLLSPPWIGAELAETLCPGNMHVGQAELHQVQPPHGSGMGLTLVRKRGTLKSSPIPILL